MTRFWMYVWMNGASDRIDGVNSLSDLVTCQYSGHCNTRRQGCNTGWNKGQDGCLKHTMGKD